MKILTFVVTFAVSFLAGMGVGGAGLLTVFLIFALGEEQLAAQGTNLLLFLFAAAGALSVHMTRTPILWGAFLFLLPCGVAGCFLGAKLAFFLPKLLLRRIFGTFLFLTGVRGLFRKEEKSIERLPS